MAIEGFGIGMETSSTIVSNYNDNNFVFIRFILQHLSSGTYLPYFFEEEYKFRCLAYVPRGSDDGWRSHKRSNTRFCVVQ